MMVMDWWLKEGGLGGSSSSTPIIALLLRLCLLLMTSSSVTATPLTHGVRIRQEGEGYFGHLHHLHPEEGEVVQVHFRTRLTSPSDLILRDFHIVHLQLPNSGGSSSSSLEIHLHKNEHLVHPSLIMGGGGEGSPLTDAIFRGDLYPPEGGSVALVATASLLQGAHEHGFRGHIIQGGNHWYLEPFPTSHPTQKAHFERRRGRRSSSSSDNSSTRASSSLPHKVYNMETILHHHLDNGTHVDVAHVPREELEKAIQDMVKDEQEEEEKEMMTTTSTTSPPTTTTHANDDGGEKIDHQIQLETKEDATPTLANTFASNNQNNNQKRNKNRNNNGGGRKPIGNKNKGKFRGGSRTKNKGRQKTSPPPSTKSSSSSSAKGMEGGSAKIVEIAVFADSKMTTSWEAKHPKEGKARMKTFILSLINNMNQLYEQSSLGVPLSLRLVHLEMLSSGGATTTPTLDPNGGEATKYLKSFCKYAGSKNVRGGQWDHALLLTAHDLKDAGDKSVAGMAWFSTMCLKYWSCSVSEGTSFATSFILTHELGHSLGMEHDGSGVSKACPSHKFIMSPTTGKGKLAWSSCSSQNLKDFLAKGTAESGKKDVAAVPTCLTRPSSLKNQQIRFSYSSADGGSGSGSGGTKLLPGELYTLDNQCQLDCGNNCTHHIIKSQEEVCEMLWCGEGGGGSSAHKGDEIEVRSAHPALEGSPCGTAKHCRYGKCVQKPAATG